MNSPLGRMVLNPDVTVRTRGVMEKCSLCVQRIQLGKNQALLQRAPLADGDIADRLPAGVPDAGDRVRRSRTIPAAASRSCCAGRRAYRVLEELGTRPERRLPETIETEEKA